MSLMEVHAYIGSGEDNAQDLMMYKIFICHSELVHCLATLFSYIPTQVAVYLYVCSYIYMCLTYLAGILNGKDRQNSRLYIYEHSIVSYW